MLLVIDVGNTQTAIGLYQGSDMVSQWRIATNKHATADELRAILALLMLGDSRDRADVKGAAIACVVTRLTDAWQKAVRDLAGVEALHCTAQAAVAAGVFTTTYPNPAEIGSDRVADAVAARARYGFPVVVVDFGTATNIEVIDDQGSFVGGIIAPGMETSAEALFSHATKLSSTQLRDPGTAIGTCTAEAVQAGVVYGEAARADGLVRRVFGQLGYEARVVTTGGLAPLVSQFMEVPATVDADLTLEGLRLLYESCRDSALAK